MGYNVISSLLCEKSNELNRTVDPRKSLTFEHQQRNLGVSTWIPTEDRDLSLGKLSLLLQTTLKTFQHLKKQIQSTASHIHCHLYNVFT